MANAAPESLGEMYLKPMIYQCLGKCFAAVLVCVAGLVLEVVEGL